MGETFENAPLVEIVAELRWDEAIEGFQGISPTGPVTITSAPTGGPQHEQFYSDFANAAAAVGFNRSERLLPTGFPALPHQVVVRFRRNEGSELLQIGPGIFSANGLPPYRSWTEFGPIVAHGVECLLKARVGAARQMPFSALSLRYIDGFRAEHMNGRDSAAFMREVLGLGVTLPAAATRQLRKDGKPNFVVQAQLPVADALQLSLSIGEGHINNSPSLVMDTTVASTIPVTASLDAVMKAFAEAREIIHNMFIDMIEPIRHVLKPNK